MAAENFLRGLEDDGLYTPTIKAHSLEKIRRHNYFAKIFATGMRKKWAQLAYIGLYSGSGRARLERSGEIVETTAMSVLRLPDPFTKYVFVDSDEHCTNALAGRAAALPSQCDISILLGNVHEVVPLVRGALPPFGPTVSTGPRRISMSSDFFSASSTKRWSASAISQLATIIIIALRLLAKVSFNTFLFYIASTLSASSSGKTRSADRRSNSGSGFSEPSNKHAAEGQDVQNKS